MGEVIAKYPDSEYADDARNKIEVARDQIAGKEMQIGRYYRGAARISWPRSTASARSSSNTRRRGTSRRRCTG